MTGGPSTITRERFAEIVSPEYFIAVRDRLGGPRRAALGEALAAYRRDLRRLADAADADAEREEAAAAMRPSGFDALT